MSEAEKHLQNARAELLKARPYLLGAEQVDALNEVIMVVEILAAKAADESRPKPVTNQKHD